MNEASAHLLISGRVQGVFFRAFTAETAQKFGLSGWVRNISRGRVEALLEGPRADIEKALRQLQEGPPASRVECIDVQWQEPTGEYDDFIIRY